MLMVITIYNHIVGYITDSVALPRTNCLFPEVRSCTLFNPVAQTQEKPER